MEDKMMVKRLGACIEKQMSAFSTKKVKVYIGVSPVPPDPYSDVERILCKGVEDPDEVAGKLMDLSLTHYVWDWNVSEETGDYGKKWLAIDLILVPSKNYTTNIDADLIEPILNRMGTRNDKH